ncbi:hypothetical protein PC128_g25941 [Phytophthora cactorum]|nr:hypothetical protein PC128_g25941 [Phytophthora cactorum]
MQPGVLDMLTVIKRKHIQTKGVAYVQNAIKSKCEEEKIAYVITKWMRFWTYFAKVWITKYGSEVWNVHGLDRGLVNCTNHPLERFNREMNEAFSAPHPTAPVFVSTVERLARGHVQRRLDTPSRARKRPRYDVQLPRAVVFESSDESDAPAPHEPALGEDEYSDDSDSSNDAPSESEEDASSNDSGHDKEDNDNSCFNDFAFEYGGDDESVRDSAIV